MFLKGGWLIVLIKYDRNFFDVIRIREVHVAIGPDVVDPQTVIIVDFVALLLVRAMRDYFEDDLAG